MSRVRDLVMVRDSVENRKKCLCKGCPSYPNCGDILFCATGKSNCEIEVKGCICNYCQVYAENDLSALYYCNKDTVGESNIVMRKKRSEEEDQLYQGIVDIKDIANSGKSVVSPMGSLKKLPFSFNDLHFVPAQVARIPLNKEDEVNTEVLIGSKSKRPLKLRSPIIVSGMSYGSVSRKVRMVISRTASKLKTGFNSGEGGIIEEELEAADYMIGQYATGRFGIDEGSMLSRVAAVEIRFGQGAYPGKGSYLPADKMTEDIARVRGLKKGEAAYSPAHHPDMTTPQQVKEKVEWLRTINEGPIGAKIGCGDIEEDIQVLVDAGVDYIALDGFGGGTGATTCHIRENMGIPILSALPRAYNYLSEIGVKDKVSIIAGGGLRTSADFTKCLALGADAVYIGTAALIAINCEQHRVCHTGLCPTGITAHQPDLMKQLDVEEGIRKLSNFITVYTEEMTDFARAVGKDDVNKLNASDLVSMNKDLAEITGVKWLK
ncbi:MAG: glutamate synthase-related protein [Halobacteriota archaeon]